MSAPVRFTIRASSAGGIAAASRSCTSTTSSAVSARSGVAAALHTAYPIAPAVAGASGSSITLTQATVPELDGALQRRADRRAARSTCSP